MENTLNQRLLDYIAASPTAFHAVANTAAALDKAGFTALDMAEDWALTAGGKYYLTVNGTTLLAFRLPSAQPTGFMVTASHSDSPTFKIKPGFTRHSGDYVQLNTERYGGTIHATWFDRPLGVAGRVLLADVEGRISAQLVYPDRDLAIIPSVAPHLNSEANSGFKVNLNVDTFPLLAQANDPDALLQQLLGSGDGGEVVGHDLYLVCRDRGAEVGTQGQFLCAPRLDDLACAFGCLEGFLQAGENDAINVYALFDNEEVGSATRQGAGSTLLATVLQRIANGCGCDYARLLPQSFLVSADNAHAIHPNHPEFSDPQNAPKLNGGLVVKFNAAQRYTTDGVSAALFTALCAKAGVQTQTYANRSDLPGGTTLGGIATTHAPLRAVDIGLPQLAMHSCYETMGSADLAELVTAATALYSHSLRTTGDSWMWK